LFVSVWVAQVWGPDNAALPVGAALAVVGSVLTQPGSADRRRVAAALTVNLSIVVAIGILAGGHPPLFIGAVVAACLIAGLLWMFGGGAGLTGVAVLVVLLASGAVPATLSATVQTVGMVLGFGVAHLLFAARWTRREELAERRAIAARYRDLAGYAGALVEGRSADLPAEATPDVAATDIPLRIAATLQSLCSDNCSGCNAPSCVNSLRAAADVLAALGDERRQASSRATDALHRLDELHEPATTAAVCRLRGQLHEAVAARFGLDEPLSATGPRLAIARALDQIHWGSPLVRHSVRLAVGVGAALALAWYRNMPEGLWMALAVLLVLRPVCPRLYERCVERIAGAAAGMTLATSIVVIWHPGPAVIAFLVVAFLATGWAVHAQGPWGITTVVAAAVAIAMEPGPADGVLGHRLAATAIGAVIAVAMYLLVPEPPRAKVCRGITEVLRAQVAYAAVEVKAFVDPAAVEAGTRNAARDHALMTRRVFESGGATAHLRTAETADLLDTARHEADALALAVAVLDTQLPRHRHLPGAVLSQAGEEYATALLGSCVPWRLDSGWLLSAGEALRLEAASLNNDDEGVAVLLAQLDAITRHALALSDLAERVTGHLSHAYAIGDNVH
jgi:uncharacterized membrane protein YccC